MRTAFEPRFARIAAMIGDATRSRMLACLLGGELVTASEIAKTVDVTPQTASAHLAKLLDAGLVAVRAQGRHRYYALADGDIAHALEALAIVGERTSGSAHRDVWCRDSHRAMRDARRCYGHLAGRLGVALHDALLDHAVVRDARGRFELGEHASSWLGGLGIDAAEVRSVNARGVAYPCVDWSERRDHFAGPLAKAVLDRFLDAHWLVRVPDSRALTITPKGRARLVPLLGTRWERPAT